MPVFTHCFRVDLSKHPAQPYQFCKLEWKPNKRHGIVWLGDRPIEFDEVLRRTSPTSKYEHNLYIYTSLVLIVPCLCRSRRFTASNGEEYKWQQTGPDNRDLEVRHFDLSFMLL